ncbi:MAG TPA: peptidoglycan DD-metalloendopeptidase family protein [Mycobacteriales bacterium]|jgi:murein DD-endopeptidase MepM/ murein hydrolase activator NlpD|nr:peptidoglycan DD-metalloendopeptidase family protein [Mycobacteriales bacterium]
MSSPGRAALRTLLVGAAVPLALVVAAVPASSAPISPGAVDSLRGATSAVAGGSGAGTVDLASAQVEADRLRTEVDALTARARKSADAADRAETRYVALAAETSVAQRELDEAHDRAESLAGLGTARVRALYMAGGRFGAVNTVLRARDLGELSSARENVAVIVDEDTARTATAEAAEARAAAAKATLDRLTVKQAAAAAAAAAAVGEAAAALRTRRDLLGQADATVRALLSARAAEEATATRARAAAVDLGAVPVTGDWARPAVGPLSSPFGPRWGTLHAGLDIAARSGSVIRAASGGTVTLARWYGGYGNAVEIDHGGGLATRYGHASELLVVAGEYVAAGQPIALVGSTGDSTGAHLHFEVRVDGSPIDPLPFMLARGVDLR